MNKYIESIFYHDGLKCCVIFTILGHRCGYVGIPKDHPLYGIKHSQDMQSPELLQELKSTHIGKRGILDIFCWDGEATTPAILFDVHGGITYSGGGTTYPLLQVEPMWWYGFDCSHTGDAKDWDTLEKLVEKKKWEPLWKIEQMYPVDGDVVRTNEYVKEECKTLASKIKCVGELLLQTRLQIMA